MEPRVLTMSALQAAIRLGDGVRENMRCQLLRTYVDMADDAQTYAADAAVRRHVWTARAYVWAGVCGHTAASVLAHLGGGGVNST